MPQYEQFSGNATDTYGATIAFSGRTKQVDITAWDNNLEITASYDGAASHFEGDIEIPSGTTFPTPLACEGIRVRNRTAGQVARYEIIAWYMPSEYQ